MCAYESHDMLTSNALCAKQTKNNNYNHRTLDSPSELSKSFCNDELLYGDILIVNKSFLSITRIRWMPICKLNDYYSNWRHFYIGHQRFSSLF